MATPKYYRPSLPYVPHGGRNTNRFERLGNHPAHPAMLDAEQNAIADYINTNLVDAIDNIVAGVLVGSDNPDNADKLVTTDGDGNVSWTKVNSTNIEDKSIIAANVADETLTGDQIATGSIPARCLDADSVTNAKIKDHDISLTKTKATGKNCFLGSSVADASYREIEPTAAWQIPTIENNHPRCESISTIWNNSANNACSGGKLADNSVPAEKLRDPVIPVGGVIMWSAVNVPLYFLQCDGRSLSRTTYGALFAVIGTSYGAGDGSTTFNIPDLRGRAVFGVSGQSGRLTQGTEGGAEYVKLSVNNLPPHNHAYKASDYYFNGKAFGDPNGQNIQYANVVDQYTESAGANQAFNNMPPFLTMLYIIRAC